jgi:neutral ceramidase
MKENRGRKKDPGLGVHQNIQTTVDRLALNQQLYLLLKTGLRSSICGLFLMFIIIQNLHAQQEKVFMAGASKSNVTPPLGEILVGGYGAPVATHIHDELHARNLVLDDGQNRLVIVLVDNVSINREVFDEAKRRLQKDTGIPEANMLMAATHTHSATSASGLGEKRRGWNFDKPLDEYQNFVVSRIVDGVKIAINNLEPARIGWGSGQVPQHVFNRRWKLKEAEVNPFGEMETVKMNPGVGNPNLLEPAGPTDPEVSFISVQSLEGRPIALLGNYSLHYVGGVGPGHVSADYFAVFADRIQELLKADRQDPPFIGIMSNGTSGDVNNINYGGQPEKNERYAKMKKVADDVANEVFRVYQTLEHQDWVPLKATRSELRLQVRDVSPELVSRSKMVMSRPDSVKPIHSLEKIYAQRVLQFHEEWPDEIDIVLQTFRIGDLGIAAIPFETFTETGLEIKERSLFKDTFTIELANGNYGYLPTPAQHELGGYETWLTTNRVETRASEKIVAELLTLFGQLK